MSHLMNIVLFSLAKRMLTLLLMAVNTNSLLVHLKLFKLIVIFLMEMQSSFQEMELILVELVFIVESLTFTKELMLVRYLII